MCVCVSVCVSVSVYTTGSVFFYCADSNKDIILFPYVELSDNKDTQSFYLHEDSHLVIAQFIVLN